MSARLQSMFDPPTNDEAELSQFSSTPSQSYGAAKISSSSKKTPDEADLLAGTSDDDLPWDITAPPPMLTKETSYIKSIKNFLFGSPKKRKSRPINLKTRKLGDGMEVLQSPEIDQMEYSYEQTVFGSYRERMAAQARRIVRDRKVSELKRKPGITDKCFSHCSCSFICRNNQQIYVFIMVVSILCICINILIDLGVYWIRAGNHYLLELISNRVGGFFSWTGYIMAGVLLSVFVTNLISVNAVGSGIPEMKCILSGVTLLDYLSKRTLLAKISGFTLALGSYLSIGKQGPFVHMACIITNQLSKLPCFMSIRRSEGTLQMMLGAAVATGVGANFGSPVGAMLFSIEVTSTYYPIRNYWFSTFGSFFAAQVITVIWNFAWGYPLTTPRIPTEFETTEVNEFVIILAVIIGVGSGLLGSFFVRCHMWHIRLRRYLAKFSPLLFQNKWVYAVFISIITAAVTYPEGIGSYTSIGAERILYNLFRQFELHSIWEEGLGLIPNLGIYFACFSALTILTTSLSIPQGLFMPVLALGTVFGRLCGEAALLIYPTLGPVTAPICAVMGAASLGASVTHTFSSAIIIFELTGQITILFPVLLCEFLGLMIAKQLSYSIYDSILRARRLDYLADLPPMDINLVASQIMLKVSTKVPTSYGDCLIDDYPVLCINETMSVVSLMLGMTSNENPSLRIPVVKDRDSMLLLGSITRMQLEQVYASFIVHTYNVGEDDDSNTQPRSSSQILRPTEIESMNPTIVIPFEYSNVQILPNSTVAEVHMMFITMRLLTVFVTENGKLVGVITRENLKKEVDKKSAYWSNDIKRICRKICRKPLD